MKICVFSINKFILWLEEGGLICHQAAISVCRSLRLVIVTEAVHCTLHQVLSLWVGEYMALCLF